MCDIKYYVIRTYICLINAFYWWLTNNVAALLEVPISGYTSHSVLDTWRHMHSTIQHSFGHFPTGILVLNPHPRVTFTYQEVTYVYLRILNWFCLKFYFSLATVLLKLKIKKIVNTAQCNLVARSPCSRVTYLQW